MIYWNFWGYKDRYDDAVRFKLFSALQTNIKTMADFRYVMQWNNPKSSLSGGNPGKAIAKRSDLLVIFSDFHHHLGVLYTSVLENSEYFLRSSIWKW